MLPLITTPYVSRISGAENLGIYSYTNTIAQYFVIFAMLGLNNYGNRAVAMARDIGLLPKSIHYLYSIDGLLIFFAALSITAVLTTITIFVVKKVPILNVMLFGKW